MWRWMDWSRLANERVRMAVVESDALDGKGIVLSSKRIKEKYSIFLEDSIPKSTSSIIPLHNSSTLISWNNSKTDGSSSLFSIWPQKIMLRYHCRVNKTSYRSRCGYKESDNSDKISRWSLVGGQQIFFSCEEER